MTRERECQLLYWRSQQISVRFNVTVVEVQLDDFGNRTSTWWLEEELRTMLRARFDS